MIKQFLFSKKGLVIMTSIFMVFLVFVLPYVSTLSETRTNTPFSPDTSLLYTKEHFYNSMALYGASGRRFYIIMRWTFDVIWPVVYTGFFISVIANLTTKVNTPSTARATRLPLLAVLFDFTENIFETVNVAIYPNQSGFLLTLLQVSTLLKWLFIGLTGLLICYLIMVNIMTKRRCSTD